MWKLIIILVLIIYLLNKISVVLFRVMGRPQNPPQNFRPASGDGVHVDNSAKRTPRKGGIKGGEYVDYEEVK